MICNFASFSSIKNGRRALATLETSYHLSIFVQNMKLGFFKRLQKNELVQ